MELLKKENILIAVAIVCVALYFWGKKLNENKQTQKLINWLPIAGGLAFGLNTLITVTK